MWDKPSHVWEDVPLAKPKLVGHRAVFRDFQQAVARRRRPLVTGEDGRNSVELANAMILSSFTGRPVRLPVSRSAYERLMSRLIAQSERRRGGASRGRAKKKK
jgi:hypothetical protein